MRIVNGGFQVSQKYGDMAVMVETSEFRSGPDMWYGWGMQNQGKFSMARVTDDDGNYVELKVLATDPQLQYSDIYVFGTMLEAKRLAGLGFGRSMRSFTICFEVKSSVAMTLPLALIRSDLQRSNVIPITISGNGTWEQKMLQVVSDNWPGWLISENVAGMYIELGLAVGAEWHAPETGWRDGGFTGLPGMTNFMAATNSIQVKNFRINYESHDADATLQACKRHYIKSFKPNIVPFHGSGDHVGAVVGACIGAGVTAQAYVKTDLFRTPRVTLHALNGASNAQAKCLSNGGSYTGTAVICQGASGFTVIGMPPAGTGAGADMAVHFEAEAWVFGE
jgi:hypothetical protein